MELRPSDSFRESKVDETKLGFNGNAPLLENTDSKRFWGVSTTIAFVVGFIIANIVIWIPLGLLVFSKNFKSDSSSPSSNSALIDDDDSHSQSGHVLAESVLPKNFPATGIRLDNNNNVIITGGTGPPSLPGNTTAYIYYGPIANIPSFTNAKSLHYFHPTFPNETVNASMFYGPNSPLYDHSISEGNIRVVGAYQPSDSPYQFSFIYLGPLDGTGTYTKMVFQPRNIIVDGKKTTDGVAKTVAHSTMGDYVVGNIYFQSSESRGHGFIYDLNDGSYQVIDRAAYSTTLYGIWQNGIDSTSYTIIGGGSNSPESVSAFIENFDAFDGKLIFSGYKNYSFEDDASATTHFEGISAFQGGYSIAASKVIRGVVGAAYAFIPVLADGSFGDAQWFPFNNTINGEPTFCDTVIDSTIFGVYPLTSASSSDGSSLQTFLANFSQVATNLPS